MEILKLARAQDLEAMEPGHEPGGCTAGIKSMLLSALEARTLGVHPFSGYLRVTDTFRFLKAHELRRHATEHPDKESRERHVLPVEEKSERRSGNPSPCYIC